MGSAPVTRLILALAVLSFCGIAQEELWRVWPVPLKVAYASPCTLGDFDGDGYQDVAILAALDPFTLNERRAVHVLSGVNGGVLFEHVHGYFRIYGPFAVGDVDGDGSPDYAITFDNQSLPNRVEVWSPRLDRLVTSFLSGSSSDAFGERVVGVNLDTDPRNELGATSIVRGNSRLYAYNDTGTPMYNVDLTSGTMTQWARRGLGNVGDIDGDGFEDIGVGLVEITGRGAVRLFSGQTGNTIRTDFGTMIGDAIGHNVLPMGDMDLDGVPDYVACNNVGYRDVVHAFSGADGHVIQEWSVSAERLVGNVDLDLDGVADVFYGSPYLVNVMVSGTGWTGRIGGLSGRDRGVLWELANLSTPEKDNEINSPSTRLGQGLCCLGAQPGNPYPVIVVTDWLAEIGNHALVPWDRIRAIRVNLAGTAVSGAGCNSCGAPLNIGVRTDPLGLRVTLDGAPNGAPAWLMVGPASSTQWRGLSLPASLGPLGVPGCSLLAPPDLVFYRTTGLAGWDAGYAAVSAPVTATTQGFGVAAQWLCLMPGTGCHAMSPRHTFTVR